MGFGVEMAVLDTEKAKNFSSMASAKNTDTTRERFLTLYMHCVGYPTEHSII